MKKCCKEEKNQGLKIGLLVGLISHSFCIAFIIFTVIGSTTATYFLRPFLLNPYFFYILIVLSVVFASISAIFYFRKQGIIIFNNTEKGLEFNFLTEGIKRKWKYLLTLYSSVIGVNILFFFLIFPIVVGSLSNNNLSVNESVVSSEIILKVDIPCPGHAPLIIDELKKVDGVLNVKYDWPNIFSITFDSKKVSKEKILSQEVFNSFKATIKND
ncbi:MAG: heavy-metal-associated domain-containing protein [Candidatus Aenigmarchaeota archaeon]|nr:heavy-metal-associated domain-containing protein [Candidatus Aenigmarchaeota archaeon]